MKDSTLIGEIAAAGVLIGSYPIDRIVRRAESMLPGPCSEPVILIHGLGGGRSNLLAMATYLRLAGFDNVTYFEYPARQGISDSAHELLELIEKRFADSGVHLVGHSLG